jgi:hypothetical protein
LGADLWFSSGTPVSSINKPDRNEITEILLKVAFNTITLPPNLDLLTGLATKREILIFPRTAGNTGK